MHSNLRILTARPVWTDRAAPTLAAVLAAALLGGCAATAKQRLLPEDMPNMSEVYKAHFASHRQGEGSLHTARTMAGGHLQTGPTDLAGYTRDAYTEIEMRFPRLPNPTFIMYIDPHLTVDGHPVPGYSTAFDLYETTQYALPGEAPLAGGTP